MAKDILTIGDKDSLPLGCPHTALAYYFWLKKYHHYSTPNAAISTIINFSKSGTEYRMRAKRSFYHPSRHD